MMSLIDPVPGSQLAGRAKRKARARKTTVRRWKRSRELNSKPRYQANFGLANRIYLRQVIYINTKEKKIVYLHLLYCFPPIYVQTTSKPSLRQYAYNSSVIKTSDSFNTSTEGF